MRKILLLKWKKISDPQYSDLITSIIDLSYDDAKKKLDDFFNKNKVNSTSNEEQIAEVFGVSTDNIEHIFLKNGVQVFKFYSAVLGRDVVLENNVRGKSLSDILSDYQQKYAEKYTSVNDAENSNDILMDIRLNSDIEMKLFSLDEVRSQVSEISSLNEEQLELLNYLLNNADSFNINLINISNLFFITNDHKLMEITYDKNHKPIVGEPNGELEHDNAVFDVDDNVVDEKEQKEEGNDSFINEDNPLTPESIGGQISGVIKEDPFTPTAIKEQMSDSPLTPESVGEQISSNTFNDGQKGALDSGISHNNELNSMFDDSSFNVDEENVIAPKESSIVPKQKALTLVNDIHGYSKNLIFLILAVAFILLLFVLYYVFKYIG